MINAPSGFVTALNNDNRNYQMLITLTLKSGTVLSLDNSVIWTSGFTLEDAIATTSDSLELGTAIVNQATLVINNMNENYSAYDFGDAAVRVQIGLRPNPNSSISYIDKGRFSVQEVTYNGTLITLVCLDNMRKFDRQYVSSLTFPATAYNVVAEACTACAVTLGVNSFTGGNISVPAPPTEAVTFRNVIAWVGQMIGCCWRINTSGDLMPVWYTDYNLELTSSASENIAMDDTEVTGIEIVVTTAVEDEESAEDEVVTVYSAGTAGYTLHIEENPLINNDNGQAVADYLLTRMASMDPYRKGVLVHPSDPRIEAGDIITYTNRKGYEYPLLVSMTTFTIGAYQSTTSASETPARNTVERFSASTQTTVKVFQAIQRERNTRETAEAALQQAIDDAPGLYMSTETESGATVYILHNAPAKADSTIVWKMSSQAVGVSTNGGQTYNAGLLADGTAIAQRLYAETITSGIVQSADYVASAITDDVYSAQGMIVDLEHKLISAPYFAVTSGGGLYAKSGTIGGFTIGANSLYKQVTSGGVTYQPTIYAPASPQLNNGAFYVQATSNGTTTFPFAVYYDGSIKSTKGTIAGFTIDETSLSAQGINMYSDGVWSTTGYLQIARDRIMLGESKSGSSEYDKATVIWLTPLRESGEMYGALSLVSYATSGTETGSISLGSNNLTIHHSTDGTSTYESNNPRITFTNRDWTQGLSLVFSDYDSIANPASLTLAGNQGGEYFIAPKIKATSDIQDGSGNSLFNGLYAKGAFTGDLNGTTIAVGIYQIGAAGSASNLPSNFTYGDFIQLPYYTAQILLNSNSLRFRTRTGSPAAWNAWRSVSYS